jgi:hypothetical protein
MIRRRGREVIRLFREIEPLVPHPWSVDVFVSNVAVRRERVITILTWPLGPTDPSGYWIPTSASDYIVIPVSAAGPRRDAIIAHELAHALLGHRPELGLSDPEILQALAPSVSPALAQRFLPRHGYLSRPENDAETLATLIIASSGHAADVLPPGELSRLTDRLR